MAVSQMLGHSPTDPSTAYSRRPSSQARTGDVVKCYSVLSADSRGEGVAAVSASHYLQRLCPNLSVGRGVTAQVTSRARSVQLGNRLVIDAEGHVTLESEAGQA